MYLDIHTHQPTAEGVITPRSFGIHPWLLDQPHDAGTLHLLSLLEQWERQSLDEVAPFDVIGECGIDRCRPTPLEVQTTLFVRHIVLAQRLHKPLVVHCVHALDVLLHLRKQYPDGLWIFHGFTGSAQMAQQLLQHHIVPSFGVALTDPRRVKLRSALCSVGLGHFYLETDTSPIAIAEVYRAASEALDISLETLIESQLASCPFPIEN